MVKKALNTTLNLIRKNYRMLATFGFPAFVILLVMSGLITFTNYILMAIIFLLLPLMMSLSFIAKQMVEQPKNLSLKSFYFGFINIKQTFWFMFKSFGIPLTVGIISFLVTYVLLIFGFTAFIEFQYPELVTLIVPSITYQEAISLLLQIPNSMDIIVMLLAVSLIVAFLLGLWVRVPEHFTFYLSLDFKKDIVEASQLSNVLIKGIRWQYYFFQLGLVLPSVILPILILWGLPLLGLWPVEINSTIDVGIRLFISSLLVTPFIFIYYLANVAFYREVKLDFLRNLQKTKSSSKEDQSNPLGPTNLS